MLWKLSDKDKGMINQIKSIEISNKEWEENDYWLCLYGGYWWF